MTFGKTSTGMPVNHIYLYNKTSNILTNFLPYEDGQHVMTELQRRIMFHEIGHSLFTIAVGGMQDPRTRALEEGFVDYFSEKTLGKEMDEGFYGKASISAGQAANMKGLSQLDIDASIWGDDVALKASKVKNYVGVTHHAFGIEFIKAFIDVFGKEKLLEFLKRVKKSEDAPMMGDYGTKLVKGVLEKMGYSQAKITEFQNELYRRLKKNVFKVKT